jgi:hypothetical protein
MPALLEKYLSAAPDGVAVVNYQNLQYGFISIHKAMPSPYQADPIWKSASTPKSSALNLNHLEIFLARATFGTRPVHGHIRPKCSSVDSMVRGTQCLVIDPTTN